MITAEYVANAFDEFSRRQEASTSLSVYDSGYGREEGTTKEGIAAQMYLQSNLARNLGDLAAAQGGPMSAFWAESMLDMSPETAEIFASDALFPEQRKAIMRDTRVNVAREKWGEAVDNPTLTEQLVGGGLKQLMDPTNLAAIGLTLKSGALAIGLVEGAYGAATGATEGALSAEGIDPITVATYGALGFALGGGTAKVAEILSPAVRTASDAGTPLNTTEALNSLRKVFNDEELDTILKSVDLETTVGKLNAEFGMNEGKTNILKKEIYLHTNQTADSTDYIHGLKRMYNDEVPGAFDIPDVTYTSGGKILEDIYADPAREVLARKPFLKILEEDRINATRPGRAQKSGTSKKKTRQREETLRKVGKDKFSPVQFGGRTTDSFTITPETMAAREYAQGMDTYHDFVKAFQTERDVAERVFDKGDLITERVYQDSKTGPMLNGYTASGLSDSLIPKKASEIVAEGKVKYGSPTGDMVVPSMKSPEEAMQSLLDDSMVAGKRNWLSTMSSGYIGSRPWVVLEGRGKFGAALAKGLDVAFRNTNRRWSDFMHNFNKAVIENGSSIRNAKDMSVVSGLLRRTITESEVQNKELINIAKQIEADLAQVLKEARDTGIITPKKYRELAENAKEKGYFPRVYNEDYLATKKGKEHWIEALSSHVFASEVSAEIALRSIVGDEALELKKLMAGLERRGNGYAMSRALAKNIWDLRGKAQSLRRSNHLETARKIPEEFEKVLEPFLVHNPSAVLGKYYQDTMSRIESAKIFGANDEVAAKLLNGLSKDEYATKDIVNMAADVYYKSVRSEKSSTLSNAMNQPDWMKTVSGRMRALQTQKLAFAQIINLGQGTINGTTRLQAFKGSNPAKSYANALKGISTAFKSIRDPHLNEMFLRSGANAQSAIIQQMGELNGTLHTVTGRKFTGLLTPLEFVNNPSVMLRMSGFTAVEEFNRRIGYFMGKAHLDDLLARKTIALSKGNQKLVDKIDKGLIELGLDTKIHPRDFHVDDIQNALQLVSNQINFVNAPHTVPVLWDSFYGKIFAQFKTFAFHQGTFIKDYILKPLKNGNPMPLITYAGVGTPIGMGIYEFRKFIAGDDKEYTKTQEYLGWLTSFGGLGIMMDVLMQGAYGPASLTASIAGPSIGTAANVTAGAVKTVIDTVKEDEFTPDPLTKAVVREFQFPLKKKVIENIGKEPENFKNKYKNIYVE